MSTQTRQGTLDSGPVRVQQAVSLVEGMRRATLTAVTALAACLLVIVVGAAISICWDVHPLLVVGMVIGLILISTKVAGHAMRSSTKP
jgi:hypothetical protein